MDDTISRLAVIQIIEKMRARIGHNLERSVGRAMIEILDEVGEDVEQLPSAHGTNLAEVGTDLISRAAAQTELQLSARRYTVAHEAHGEGRIVWSEDLISVSDAMDVLRKIPSAQPTFDARDTQYNLPIGTDLISRAEAIDALWAWMNDPEDDRESAFDVLKQLPPIQPKRGGWIHDGSKWTNRWICSECGYKWFFDCIEGAYCPNCGADMRTKETDCDYERAVEQLEHDMLYEPTFNQDDGSM